MPPSLILLLTIGERYALPERQLWLVLAIALAGEQGLSPVQIQKAMFLLRMEASGYVGVNFYEFQPYNYGPFSTSIYNDVDVLVFGGLLRTEARYNYSQYVATDIGRARANEFSQTIDKHVFDFLTQIIQWIKSVDFSQLLRSIYAKYPAFAVNSVFRR
jgi:hypothetical protein